MDVNTILQLTWPASPGQSLLEATSRWHRKSLNIFLKRWEKERAIPYFDLLEFAHDPRFPSVTLAPASQQGLVTLLLANAGEETRLALVKRADRALSLNGRYFWAEKIHLMDDGKARLYADEKHAAELRKIRKEYLK